MSPVVELNQYFNWIQQDDIISSSWGILESDNLDWTRTWYGITLWPKPAKKILTATTIIRWIYSFSSTASDGNLVMYWDGWNIYLWTSSDDTPYHTLANWYPIHNMIFSPSNKYYMALKTATDVRSIARVNSNITTGYTDIQTGKGSICPLPMLSTNTFLYVWAWWVIYRYDNSDVETTFNIFQSHIVWITRHGTQFYVYNQQWNVSLWDWVSTSVSANIDLWLRIERVESLWWIDYAVTDLWDVYVISWYTSQNLSKKKLTNRWNDNSQYTEKLNFSPNEEDDNRILEASRNEMFFVANETTPWIYKYWTLIEWLPPSWNKVCSTDNTNTTVDYIHWIFYNEFQNTLWYSYVQWTEYWVDMLEMNNLTTAQTWYFVTQIFRWPPNKVNKIKEIRLTTSYTSWSDYIKLYKRVDNAASWTLVRTINDSTDTIERHRITNQTDEFIDIQFKVEIHNNTQDNTPPILHWLELVYSINKE